MRLLSALLGLALSSSLVEAQNLITTLAGTNVYFQGEGNAGSSVPLGRVAYVAIDPQGRAVFSDPYYNLVIRVENDGTLHVIAGNNIQGLGGTSVQGSGAGTSALGSSAGGFSGDNGPATSATLNHPRGIAYDSQGNLYIADSYNNRIRVVNANGIISTLAGSGTPGFQDGAAANAQFNLPLDIAVSSGGVVIVNDAANNRIRKIAQGVVTTIAGNGGNGQGASPPDGATATSVTLNEIEGLATDAAGNVYFSDFTANYVREITTDLRLHTIAGNGNGSITTGTPGEGGPALQAALSSPSGLAIDGSGAIYVSVTNNQLVRKIVNGVITTIAGNSTAGFSGDGGAALRASLHNPFGVAVSPAGNVYVADRDNFRIRKIDSAKNISSVAGNAGLVFSADGKQAIYAPLLDPFGVTVDPNGSLLVADTHNNVVRSIDRSGTLSTVAGNGAQEDCNPELPVCENLPATQTGIGGPVSTSRDGSGNLLIADFDGQLVREVVAGSNVIKNFLTSGNVSKPNDFLPTQTAVDASGNTYVADFGNGIIWIVRPNKTNSVFKSGLSGPFGLAIDNLNNLYVTEYKGGRVTMINAQGVTTTIAGGGALAGSSADGKAATTALLKHPAGIALDSTRNLYFTDAGDNRVRRLTPAGATWTISTVAGNGTFGYSGDGGIATNASLRGPSGVAVDGSGTVYVADTGNNRIRAVQTMAPTLSVSTSSLSFTAIQGGAVSDPLTVDVSASAFGHLAGMLFTTSASQPWISVTPAIGATPATLEITIDPSGLAPKTYNETVTISAPGANPPVRTVAITVTVNSPPAPDLHVDNVLDTPLVINEGFSASAQPETRQIRVLNRGGGQPDISAVATMQTGTGWLSVSVSPSTASASSPAILNVTITPGNLAPGAYTGQIVVSSGGKQIGTAIPVNIGVAAQAGKLLLSSTSLNFTAVKGGSAPLPKVLEIINAGTGSLTWKAAGASLTANTPNWLALDSTGDTLDRAQTAFSTEHVSVKPGDLAVGTYYGQIKITSDNASNSPQFVTVVLNVVDATSNPGPDISANALVFVGAQGVNPSSQTIQVSNIAAQPLSYGSSRVSSDGDWIVQVPTDATVGVGQTARVVVQPDFTNLAPGSHSGTITLRFSDSTVRTIDVLSFVSGSGAAGTAVGKALSARDANSPCSPNPAVAYNVTITSLRQGFSIPAKQGTTIDATVQDCSGNVTPTVVNAYFSNQPNATGLPLTHLHDTLWSVPWTPASEAQNITIGVRATYGSPSGQHKDGQVNITGSVTSGVNPPFPKALANAASGAANAPLPPGAMVSIYGTDLAHGPATANNIPLNPTLAGATVMLAGKALPILYASSTQINAQLPYDLNTSDAQLFVQRDDTVSSQVVFVVGRAQPGIYTTTADGKGQGVILFATDPYTYVAPTSFATAPGYGARPAKAGDFLTIYCNGLGPVQGNVAAGAAVAQATPTLDTATVTIGGIDAHVLYAGLTPGIPGLYQVNVQVPNGVAPGDAVPVAITISGLTSPAVTIAVR